jgi:hypothetical protein
VASSTLLAMAVLAPAVLGRQGVAWTFDDIPAGQPPPQFVSAGPDPGRWRVARDGANGVLAEDGPGGGVARLAIADGTSFGDLIVSGRLRFPAGAGSAGLAWRYRDADNYYFAALDLREQEVRIYRVTDGTRRRMEDQEDLEIDPGAWHSVKVEHQGTRIRVWIDGVPVADARGRIDDRRGRTIEEPGAVGVWTSGVSSAWFDDLRATAADESELNRRRD